MRQISAGDLIASELELTYQTTLRLVADLSTDEAGRSPTGGLSPIVWQIGHMLVIDARITRHVGRTYEIPSGYSELFGRGSGGDRPYPSLGEVQGAFGAAHNELAAAARSVALSNAAPSVRSRTPADLLIFSCLHRAYHQGKIATLRALLGKPRVLG